LRETEESDQEIKTALYKIWHSRNGVLYHHLSINLSI